MMRLTAFVPAHISGFFQICESKNPERMGSRNCGPCLEKGVLTSVRVKEDTRTRISVSINGRRTSKARTSIWLARQLLEKGEKKFSVDVDHKLQVPMGAGYGASGAGALGLALALSKALGLLTSREEAIRLAHLAEVKNLTGLGDVGAQAIGGLVMGIQPGAPPHGRWRRIRISERMWLVCCTLGPISTRELLSDPRMLTRSKKLGALAFRSLLKKTDVRNFMRVSRDFAERLGLLDSELRELMSIALNSGSRWASQVMLGRAVFAFVDDEKLKQVIGQLSGSAGEKSVIWGRIAPSGAKVLSIAELKLL